MRLSRSIEKLSRAVIARGEFEAVQGKERGRITSPNPTILADPAPLDALVLG
jgi:hypothetical protein